jgi:predicted N-acyltransferase
MVSGAGPIIRVRDGVSAIDAAQWDACAGDANPFVSHAFLSILEESGSVGRGAGWQPLPLTVESEDGTLIGAAPAYGKSHSQGEYVFDHSWAEAWQRAGRRYYPKIQVAVPFSPVPGPRLLMRSPEIAPFLLGGLAGLVKDNDLSSAHATFVEEGQLSLFREAGWLIRQDSQFHWTNEGYASFDDFLGQLSSRRRKDIRKERERARAGLEIVHLSGGDISEAHWDAFWHFYQDTGARKWGRPYLTREFFSMLGERMGDRALLMFAERAGRPIAGALNLVGADALFGRYWGASEEVPFLHFELCYYQAIDAAIARGLARVEAGAQGTHKLARGYRPMPTWSAHFIADPDFRRAVADFLRRETAGVESDRNYLEGHTPFRKGGD